MLSPPIHPCPMCEVNESGEPHPCPYAEDIDDDHEIHCECCSCCTERCAMDI